MHRLTKEVASAFALTVVGVLTLGIGSAIAENTPIYKCLDRNLGIVYTDLPCKDGEKLDLRPGDADPAAVARLERDREELNMAAQQRLADERRAAMQRDLAFYSQPPAPIMFGPGPQDNSMDYGDYGYGYPLFAYPSNGMRSRFPRANPFVKPSLPLQPRFAPNPPFKVPRQ
jgi:hypothetical protein